MQEHLGPQRLPSSGLSFKLEPMQAKCKEVHHGEFFQESWRQSAMVLGAGLSEIPISCLLGSLRSPSHVSAINATKKFFSKSAELSEGLCFNWHGLGARSHEETDFVLMTTF